MIARRSRPFMRRGSAALTGILPFIALFAAWALLPALAGIPEFKLPSPGKVLNTFTNMMADGSLMAHVWASLQRLAAGYLLGNLIAIPLGLAIALNRAVSETLTPVLSFFQSIAGIAWVPLAIIWFGVGKGSVLFVIANTIFFASIYSTVIGVRTIPQVLFRASLSHGASRWDIISNVVIPGAWCRSWSGCAHQWPMAGGHWWPVK